MKEDEGALAAALAAELGVHPGADDPVSAGVEFAERTPTGSRSTVVQIRKGKIARVIRNA